MYSRSDPISFIKKFKVNINAIHESQLRTIYSALKVSFLKNKSIKLIHEHLSDEDFEHIKNVLKNVDYKEIHLKARISKDSYHKLKEIFGLHDIICNYNKMHLALIIEPPSTFLPQFEILNKIETALDLLNTQFKKIKRYEGTIKKKVKSGSDSDSGSASESNSDYEEMDPLSLFLKDANDVMELLEKKSLEFIKHIKKFVEDLNEKFIRFNVPLAKNNNIFLAIKDKLPMCISELERFLDGLNERAFKPDMDEVIAKVNSIKETATQLNHELDHVLNDSLSNLQIRPPLPPRPKKK